MSKEKSYTIPILREFNYRNESELRDKIESIPADVYILNGHKKEHFARSITRLIGHIEHEGDVVRETRAMTNPGALLESMSEDYQEIRRAYLRLRKRLREKLQLLSTL